MSWTSRESLEPRALAWVMAFIGCWISLAATAADYGDAPDSDPKECSRHYQPQCQFHYPTLAVNNGAHHLDTNAAWLGQNQSDDDFLSSPEIHNGTWAGPLYINVLIDYNKDGDWKDTGEWVVQNTSYKIPRGKSRKISILGPPSGVWYRITLSGKPVSNYIGSGAFAIGETEDYLIGAKAPKKKKKKKKTTPPPLPFCGDGFLDPGEQCEILNPCPVAGQACANCQCSADISPPLPPITPVSPEPPGQSGGSGTQGSAGKPHTFRLSTGCKSRVMRICAAGHPQFSSKCERCRHEHLSACLLKKCMDPLGEQYIKACESENDAIGKANGLANRLASLKNKKERRVLTAQWSQQSKKIDTAKNNQRRLVQQLKQRKQDAFSQCRAQSDEQCQNQCATDDDRFRTFSDDAAVERCNGQEARCQLLANQWGAPPDKGHALGDWNQAIRHAAGNAGRLRSFITSRLKRKIHPGWIVREQKPAASHKTFIPPSRTEHRRGKPPRTFREGCNVVEVTPVYDTTWSQYEHWRDYEFTVKVPVALDLATASLRGMLALAKKVPGLGDAIDRLTGTWDKFEANELKGDDTSAAFMQTLKQTVSETLDGYVQGKVDELKAGGQEKLDALKGKVTDKLKSSLLSNRQRANLKRVQGFIKDASETYDNLKKVSQLPQQARDRIRKKMSAIQQEAGLCSEKLQEQIASSVKSDIGSYVGGILKKDGGTITITNARFTGNGWTSGCAFAARIKAHLPYQRCEEPACDLSWDQRSIGTDENCGERAPGGSKISEPSGNGPGTDGLDCPDCGVEIVQVIPHSGNNPLDTIDPVAGGDTTGRSMMSTTPTGGGGTTGGGTTGGGGVGPCSAGPIGYGSGFNIVNFSYIENTGQCEVQADLNQSPPFLAHGAPILYIRKADGVCTTPLCLFMANAFWSLVSATPAATVTPGQFGQAYGLPSNTPVSIIVQCTGAGCPAGNPSFTGTVIANGTQAQVQNFRPQ